MKKIGTSILTFALMFLAHANMAQAQTFEQKLAAKVCPLMNTNRSACTGNPSCRWLPKVVNPGSCVPRSSGSSFQDQLTQKVCPLMNTNRSACTGNHNCQWLPAIVSPGSCIPRFSPSSFTPGDEDSSANPTLQDIIDSLQSGQGSQSQEI